MPWNNSLGSFDGLPYPLILNLEQMVPLELGNNYVASNNLLLTNP